VCDSPCVVAEYSGTGTFLTPEDVRTTVSSKFPYGEWLQRWSHPIPLQPFAETVVDEGKLGRLMRSIRALWLAIVDSVRSSRVTLR
jgi:hypothetical protein